MSLSTTNCTRYATLLFAAVITLPGQTPSPPKAAQPAVAPPPAPVRPAAGRNFLISRDVPTVAAAERGQKLFVAQCGFCHGSNANGGETGPDLIRSALALNDEGGDKLGPVILNGRVDKGMPAFHFTESQIKDVAAFLRARQQAAIDRGTYQILNIVTGDPAKGKAYFDANCAACHSASGDLAGIAGKFEPVALQSRFLYPQSRLRGRSAGRPSKLTVTVSGQKYSGALEYLDDFEVGLRDANGDYHGFARGGAAKIEIQDPLARHEELLKQYSDADMHNILAYLETLK